MGKDKAAKGGKNQQKPPIAAPEPPTKPASKGHRQRGAGTVITAKAAVTTNDGIVLKPHEKLPFQLLHEICQREKKNVRSFSNPPGRRFRIVLSDGRNSRNDMSFVTEQSFDSDSVARDFSALLALFHLQKSMPLERRLPEPYRSTWLDMVSTNRSDPTKATAQSGTERAAVKTSGVGGQGTAKSSEEKPKLSQTTPQNNQTVVQVAHQVDAKTADWLCDACSAQNYATLLSGAPRNKCFKCQKPRGEGCVLVQRRNESNKVVVTKNVAADGTQKLTKRAPPAPVKNLRAQGQFISRAEADKVREEKRQQSRRKKHYFDALRRANLPMPIYVSKAMRMELEAVVGHWLDAKYRYSSNTEEEYEDLEDLLMGYSVKDSGLYPQEICYLPPAKQYKMLLEVNEHLLRKGFSKQHAVEAIQHALQMEAHSILEDAVSSAVVEQLINAIDEANDNEQDTARIIRDDREDQIKEAYSSFFVEACIQFICSTVSEEELPAAYNPMNFRRPGLTVVKTAAVKKDSRADIKPHDIIPSPNSSMGSLRAKLVVELPDWSGVALTKLCAYGWAPLLCYDVITALFSASPAFLPIDSMLSVDDVVMISNILLYVASTESRKPINDITSEKCSSVLERLRHIQHDVLRLSSKESTESCCPENILSAEQIEELEAIKSIYTDAFSSRLNGAENDDMNRLPVYLLSVNILSDISKGFSETHDSAIGEIVALFRQVSVYIDIMFLLGSETTANKPHVFLRSDALCDESFINEKALSHLRTAISITQEELWDRIAHFDATDSFIFSICSDAAELIREQLSSNTFSEHGSSSDSKYTSLPMQKLLQIAAADGQSSSADTDALARLLLSDDTVAPADRSSTLHTDSVRKSHPAKQNAVKGGNAPSGGAFDRSDSNSFWSDDLHFATAKCRSLVPPPEILEMRQKLPAWQKRGEFIEYFKTNRAVVVTGETGCGKTTQIPQFLYEYRSQHKIVICQPRRLAAIGVAARVAEEMGCKLGEEVGFMVKGESKCSGMTKIVFCTYGVILRVLQDDANLRAIDTIILDEVHERGIDSDFTLALLILALSSRPELRLILMSATISTDKFAKYLGYWTQQADQVLMNRELKVAVPSAEVLADVNPVPVLFIPGYTYPVREYFKADFEDYVRNYPLSIASRSGDDEEGLEPQIIGGVQHKGGIDYNLLTRLIIVLVNGAMPNQTQSADCLFPAQGCVLVFLPGVPEINRLRNLVLQHWARGPSGPNLNVLTLHGNLSPTDQRKVFVPAASGEVKVVIATNVAEASVTIPDVTVVVDSCRVKEMSYDPELQATSLTMKFAAQDSLRQRKGRAGRVKAGRCFRLITKGTFEKLPAHSTPEMLRVPLDSVILQVKTMIKKLNDSSQQQKQLAQSSMELLSRCVDVPPESAILTAEQMLTQIQAVDPETGELTALGLHLSQLPCSPRIGKMLVYSALLGCVFPASCAAAAVTLRTPFLTTNLEDAYKATLIAASKKRHSALHSDYTVYVDILQRFYSQSGASQRRRFCKDYGLSYDRVNEICESQKDFLRGLLELGLIHSVSEALDSKATTICNRNSGNARIVAACHCAGLYPQIAKVLRPPKKFVDVMGSAIERDLEARELKLYVPSQTFDELMNNATYSSSGAHDAVKKAAVEASHALMGQNLKEINSIRDKDISTEGLHRAFIHPSSINFDNNKFRVSNYLLYGERSLVVQHAEGGSKLYLRQTSEVTPFGLLFFGDTLEAQFLSGTVTLDGWIRFTAPGRTVALIKAIRAEFDHLLMKNFQHHNSARRTAEREEESSGSRIDTVPCVLDLVCRLLETDGGSDDY